MKHIDFLDFILFSCHNKISMILTILQLVFYPAGAQANGLDHQNHRVASSLSHLFKKLLLLLSLSEYNSFKFFVCLQDALSAASNAWVGYHTRLLLQPSCCTRVWPFSVAVDTRPSLALSPFSRTTLGQFGALWMQSTSSPCEFIKIHTDLDAKRDLPQQL